MDVENELRKVREEAARYRTQLSPYKKAFEGLDEDQINWVLDSIKMVQTDPVNAGTRFATLAYANLGEEGFETFSRNLLGDRLAPEAPTQIETGKVRGMDAELQQWAQQFEQRMMQALQQSAQAIQQHVDGRLQENTHRQEYERITQVIRTLGYDPDSWQGKMLVQIASDEAEGVDPESRLKNADGIIRARIAPEALGVPAVGPAGIAPGGGEASASMGLPSPEQQYTVVGGVRIPVAPTEPAAGFPVADVPPTGGNIGGAGVANGASSEPNTFGDADDALMSLLSRSPGE